MTGHGRRASVRIATIAIAIVAALLIAGPVAARAASIKTFQVPSASSGLESIVGGPDGNLYFTENQDTVVGGQSVFHVGELTTGGRLSEVSVPFGQYDSTGEHMGPTSIASSGGRLWFLSDVGGSVYTLAPGGSSVALATSLGFGDNGEQLAPAPDGGVWSTTEPGTDLVHIDANGTPSFQTINAEGVPGTIAANPAGGVVYSNGSPALGSIDAGGNTASHPLPADGGGGDVYAMAFDRHGSLWYSSYHYSVETGCFDAAIGVLRPGATNGQTVASLDPPSGHGPCATDLTLGPDGGIWFTWTSTPNGLTPKVPSGIGRVDPSTGKVQLLDTVKSNSLLPSALAFGGDGNLYFLDSVDNVVGRLAAPKTVFASASTSTKPRAPKPTVKLARRQSLGTLRGRRGLGVTCALGGAGRCQVAATITAKAARGLHLKVSRRAKTVRVASASKKLRRKGRVTLQLKPSKGAARALRRAKRLAVTLTATSSSPKHRNRTARRTVTLER